MVDTLVTSSGRPPNFCHRQTCEIRPKTGNLMTVSSLERCLPYIQWCPKAFESVF